MTDYSYHFFKLSLIAACGPQAVVFLNHAWCLLTESLILSWPLTPSAQASCAGQQADNGLMSEVWTRTSFSERILLAVVILHLQPAGGSTSGRLAIYHYYYQYYYYLWDIETGCSVFLCHQTHYFLRNQEMQASATASALAPCDTLKEAPPSCQSRIGRLLSWWSQSRSSRMLQIKETKGAGLLCWKEGGRFSIGCWFLKIIEHVNFHRIKSMPSADTWTD